MKSNLLKNVLDWVLATSVLLTVIFFVQFYFRTKQYRELSTVYQIEMQKYQNNNNVVNILGKATMEYNQAHPDANLSRILEPANVAAGTNAPGNKSAGK